jgi:hypothetical protein
MRTLPIALLEVGARVSDLFATVLARHCDMFLFRHAPHITESCLECILVSAGGKKGRGRRSESLPDQFEYLLIPRVLAQGVEIGIVLDPGFSLVIGVRQQAFQ